MSDHHDKEHSFWVRWDDEGEPLVEMPLMLPVPEAKPNIREVLAAEADEVDPIPEPSPERVQRKYHLSEQGGIRFDEVTADRCGICGHSWHPSPCRVSVVDNGHTFECGCETAAP
jgi:hypothetical protein